MPQFIGPAIGIGTALAGSLKQNKAANRTQTSTQDYTRTGSTQGVLGKNQRQVNKAALDALLGLIQGGPNVRQADKSLLFTDINRARNSVIPRLQANFTSRGMGQSGALNKAYQENEYGRLTDRQSALAGLQSRAFQEWLQSIGLAHQFLTPRTVNTTENFSGTSTGTSPSQGGNILGATGFALSEFLKNLLSGGGGGVNLPDTGTFSSIPGPWENVTPPGISGTVPFTFG